MTRKEETGRPVEDVGCPVGGAEASAEAAKVKKKNCFCTIQISCQVD